MKKKTLALTILILLAIASIAPQTFGQLSPNFKKFFSPCPYGPAAVSCGPGTQYCIERDCIYP